jgi:ribonuclease VapC
VIVDSSAIVAILLQEEDAPAFAVAIEQATVCRLSIASFLEVSIVAQRLSGTRSREVLEQMIDLGAITLEPVTIEQGRIAADAYRRFGRGSGHPARLNFGDCFSYALARATGERLLFKGDDFGHTDIARAIPAAG